MSSKPTSWFIYLIGILAIIAVLIAVDLDRKLIGVAAFVFLAVRLFFIPFGDHFRTRKSTSDQKLNP